MSAHPRHRRSSPLQHGGWWWPGRVAVAIAGATLMVGLVSHKSAAMPQKVSVMPVSATLAEPVVSKAALSAPVAGHERTVLRRLRAFDWAVKNARGCWYTWGATGPCRYGYDCSGLVYAAYTHIGVQGMPRDTYEMLASAKLRWVPFRDARRGMLAFFGSGHVELVAYARNGQIRYTLGAREPGTTVRFYKLSQWFYPTAIYAVR